VDYEKRTKRQLIADLKNSEGRFNAVFNFPLIGMAIVSPDKQWIEVNDGICYILGYTREEVLKPPCTDLILKKFLEDISDEISGSMHEKRFARKNGTIIDVAVAVNYVENDSGHIDYLVVLIKDISERKMVEEALHESEKKYRSIFDNATEGIFQSTPEGGYIKVNPAFAKMFGYSSPEEITNDIVDVGRQLYVNPKDRERMRHLLTKHGTVKGLEAEVCRKDGSRFWTSINAHVVRSADGDTLYFEGTNQDITDRKNTEEKLKASYEQLRTLSAHINKAREEERAFVAREMHDELGQILTTLNMDISWIKKRLSATPANKLLVRKAEYMSTLVKEAIATVQKVSAELRPVILDYFGLVPALEWIVDKFRNQTGINVKLVVGADIDLEREHSTQMFRIIQESLTNVARHAEATELNLRLEREANNIVLEIYDNGKGISDAAKDDINSLGILGMRERVSIMGGEFTIDGSIGKGTTVCVRAPFPKEGENNDKNSDCR
jgi:PAS domain S-box-containing protein